MIQNFFLLNRNGICYLSVKLGTLNVDETLISGFLAAVDAFGEEMLAKSRVSEMDFGNYKMVHSNQGDLLAVAVIDPSDDPKPIRRAVTMLLNMFINSYKPQNLGVCDSEVFEGFIPTVRSMLDEGFAGIQLMKDFSSPNAIDISFLEEYYGNKEVLARILRLILLREPFILLDHPIPKEILYKTAALSTTSKVIEVTKDTTLVQSTRLGHELEHLFEEEKQQKHLILAPEAGYFSLRILSTFEKGWIAATSDVPMEITETVSPIIFKTQDKQLFRYIFGKKQEIFVGDITFELSVLDEIKRKGFTGDSAFSLLRMRINNIIDKATLANGVLEQNPRITRKDLAKNIEIGREELDVVLKYMAEELANVKVINLFSIDDNLIPKPTKILDQVFKNPNDLNRIITNADPTLAATLLMIDSKKTVRDIINNLSPTLRETIDLVNFWKTLWKLCDYGLLIMDPSKSAGSAMDRWAKKF